MLTGVLKLSPTKTRLRAVPGMANSTIDEIRKGDVEPGCQTASVAKISKAMESSQGVPKNEKATLSYAQYENPPQPASKEYSSRHCHQAYIALGSNVGNRISMIESACRQMERQGIHVVRTSSLYETKAMYLHDQASFINGACEVSRTRSHLVDTETDEYRS